MSTEHFAESLKAMAKVDLDTDGEWSADTANARCAEYARLVTRLFNT